MPGNGFVLVVNDKFLLKLGPSGLIPNKYSPKDSHRPNPVILELP
jgi:hypothetical protein